MTRDAPLSSADSPQSAYIVPFLIFLAFLILPEWIAVENPELPWWRHSPELWIYPIQTITVLALLGWFWKRYTFRPLHGPGLGVAIALGLIGIGFWLAPSLFADRGANSEGIWDWLGFTRRETGFDPTVFPESSAAYSATVGMRFLRLVIVVPLVEEIFWRGFLMRVAARPDAPFDSVPFGTHHWRAYLVTTIAFVAIHHHHDYIGAAIFGSLVYLVAVRTKSLAACVLMHAVANFALGIYVMKTGQWGLW